MAGLVKGGIGSASLDLGEGLVVGALVALNSIGSVFMPDGKTYWAWAFEFDGEVGGAAPPTMRMDLSALASAATPLPRAPRRAADLARIGSAAADCVSRAIARAVREARRQ